MEQFKRVSLLGYEIAAESFADTGAWVADRLRAGEQTAVFAMNPLKIEAADADPAVAEALRTAELLIPDGAGLLWAAKKLGKKIPERIPGVELMEEICRLAAEKGYPIFLYGTTEDNLAAASATLRERYPGIVIAGTRNGFTGDREGDVAAIRESGAGILFVAMGSPKQELCISAIRRALPELLLFQGVGGSIDVLAGAVKRAPKIWCRLRLEWLWRMLRQPRRFSQLKTLYKFTRKIRKESKKEKKS